MRIASEMLTALAVLGIDESALTEPTAPAVTLHGGATMAILNHSDMNPTTTKHKAARPMRKLFTKAIVNAMADGDELAADECFYRLLHRETLQPQNARALDKAIAAFRVAVPGYLDPEAMAEAIKDAQAAADAADAAGAESWPSAEPVETAVVVRSEDAELRSQVWALAVAVQQLAERMDAQA